jgi:hypothetical protein
MKNQLFNLEAGRYPQRWSRSRSGNFLKVGAGAEAKTNSFGSLTLLKIWKSWHSHFLSTLILTHRLRLCFLWVWRSQQSSFCEFGNLVRLSFKKLYISFSADWKYSPPSSFSFKLIDIFDVYIKNFLSTLGSFGVLGHQKYINRAVLSDVYVLKSTLNINCIWLVFKYQNKKNKRNVWYEGLQLLSK